jgi:hypothetical protein
MRPIGLFSLVLLTGFAGAASADPITYDVTVNTPSIMGDNGSLDFNFNAGPFTTQAADLQILNFSSDGSLVGCIGNIQGYCQTGDVSGQLPATVTFDNGTGFNDYFDGFTFGTYISFDVSLYGPALSDPDGVSTSGSTFAFSMFSDAAGTVPALTQNTDGNGDAFIIDVNLDGTTTVVNQSDQAALAAVSSTPEPGSLSLIALPIGLGIVFRLRQQRRQIA